MTWKTVDVSVLLDDSVEFKSSSAAKTSLIGPGPTVWEISPTGRRLGMMVVLGVDRNFAVVKDVEASNWGLARISHRSKSDLQSYSYDENAG